MMPLVKEAVECLVAAALTTLPDLILVYSVSHNGLHPYTHLHPSSTYLAAGLIKSLVFVYVVDGDVVV